MEKMSDMDKNYQDQLAKLNYKVDKMIHAQIRQNERWYPCKHEYFYTNLFFLMLFQLLQ